MLRFRAWRAGSTFDHRTLIKRESVLLDQLHSAVHAELTLLHPTSAMGLLAALLDRDLVIDHHAAVRTAANGCVGRAVIQIRTRFRLHCCSFVERIERQRFTRRKYLAGQSNADLQRRCADFRGADANRSVQIGDEYLAVADLARLSLRDDRFDRALELVVFDNDFELDLWHKVDHVLATAVRLRVALLPAEAADLGDGHSGQADLDQHVLNGIELVVPDDRLDLLHPK